MEIIFLNLNAIKPIYNNLSITIGAYDGIHKGHQAVLERLIKGKMNYQTAVFTFDIHPDYSLNKTSAQGMINDFKDKFEVFSSFNIDYLFVLPKDILSLTALEFNDLLKRLNVRKIVVGNDFVYGANKSGDIETLRKDFEVDVVDEVTYQNERISSTKIRKYLSMGNFKELKNMMLTNFEITGKVIEGSHIGEILGFRTANIDVDEKYQVLKNGVYKVFVIINDKKYLGVANYGINPTCNLLNKPRLEVHILNFYKDIYNETIKVVFDEFIRSEIKFNSKDELIRQIKIDVNLVKESLCELE